MNFSFFYKKGSAGYVKGEQISDYLGGKKNPEKGFEDDICLYVKTFPSGIIPKRTYIDVDDAPNTIEWIKGHPEVGIIVTAQTAKDFLSKELNRTDINVIPHAHCNYERWIRPEREIKRIGIIGSITSFQYPVDEFRKKLIDNGFSVIDKLSVSNLRNNILKNHLSSKFLINIEKHIQKPFAKINFGPSIFILAKNVQ